jgi:phosphatidylserine synthase 2
MQFTPHSWTKYEWASTKSLRNFITILILVYLELQTELNAFYLKYLLWVPVSHPLNLYRLILMFFACMPAVRELYQYVTDPKCQRLGVHAWMTVANIMTELLICIKFGEGEFTNPTPSIVRMSSLSGFLCK